MAGCRLCAEYDFDEVNQRTQNQNAGGEKLSNWYRTERLLDLANYPADGVKLPSVDRPSYLPETKMTDLWPRVDRQLQIHAPELAATLQPGVSESALTSFEGPLVV